MVVAIQQSFWQKRLFHPCLAFPCTLHDQIFEQKSESVSKKSIVHWVSLPTGKKMRRKLLVATGFSL